MATIAKFCGLERKTVWRALSELEAARYLKRTPVPGRSTRYLVVVPIDTTQPVTPPGPPNGMGGQTDQGAGSQTLQPQDGETGCHPSRLPAHEGSPEKVSPKRYSSEGALTLSDVECGAIAADVRATPESIRECLRVFNEVKAAWPNDPRTLEAFRGWVRTAKPAKSVLKPAASDTAAGPGDERPGWQAWIDAERPESVYAKGQPSHGTPWRNIDRPTREYINSEMQRRPAA